jgi:pilus assembly protein CpaF
MRQQISAALDAVVHTARMADGSRKVTGISEVVGMEGDPIVLQELFTFARDGKDADGNIVGRFVSTGIRPHFADKLKHTGGEVDAQALGFLRS